MANGITRKDVIAKAMAVVDYWSDEELEVLEKIVKSFDRKSTGKPSKTTIENVKVKNEILVALHGEPKTAKEIAEVLGYTTNKVANLLRAIVLDGKGEKIKGEKAKDAPKYKAVDGAEFYPVPEGEDE